MNTNKKKETLASLFSSLNTYSNFLAEDACIIRWEIDSDFKKLEDFKHKFKIDDCVDHLREIFKICKKIKKLDNTFFKYGNNLEEINNKIKED